MVPLTTPVDPAILREEACELASILRLFRGGRLIMDEVDLILHPLKVNFTALLACNFSLVERIELPDWTEGGA